MEGMAKSCKGSISVVNIVLVVVSFRSKCISGSDMLRFGDSEWKDLIPYVVFCNHVDWQELRKSRKITTKVR